MLISAPLSLSPFLSFSLKWNHSREILFARASLIEIRDSFRFFSQIQRFFFQISFPFFFFTSLAQNPVTIQNGFPAQSWKLPRNSRWPARLCLPFKHRNLKIMIRSHFSRRRRDCTTRQRRRDRSARSLDLQRETFLASIRICNVHLDNKTGSGEGDSHQPASHRRASRSTDATNFIVFLVSARFAVTATRIEGRRAADR